MGKGFDVKILSTSNGWYNVEYLPNTTGYVAGWYIQKYANTNSAVKVTYPSGTKVIFEDADLNNIYGTPPGVNDELRRDPVTGGYELKLKDQTKYVYDSTGKLASIVDRYGNAIKVQYDSGNVNIQKVVGPVGRSLTFKYNSSNRLWKVIDDKLGRLVEYSYDANGSLTGVFDLNGKKTTYNYYSNGKLKQIIDANSHQVIKNDYDKYDRLVKQYDGNNNVKYQIYDDLNKTESTTAETAELTRYYVNENGYESKVVLNYVLGKPVEETDAYGGVIQHNYYINYNPGYVVSDTYSETDWKDVTKLPNDTNDALCKKYLEANWPLREKITDVKKNTTTIYEYDKNDNLVRVVYPGVNNASKTSRMVYDKNNNLTDTYDIVNSKQVNLTKYTYPDMIYLQKVTDPVGNETVYNYYSKGDPTSKSGISIVISGLVSKVTENRKKKDGTFFNGFKTTQYKYEDGYNNRTEGIDALGKSTYQSYDAAGRLIQVTNDSDTANPKTSLIKYSYDNMDRLYEQDDLVWDNTANKYVLKYNTVIQYDDIGNKRFITDKNKNTTEYVYDDKNQLKEAIDAKGYKIQIDYDPMGNKIKDINQKGGVTQYEYDAVNRMIQTSDPLGYTTRVKYNVNVTNLAAVTNVDTLVENSSSYHNLLTIDPQGKLKLTEYDALNRVKSDNWQFKDKTTSTLSVKSKTYSYDSNNNLETVTEKNVIDGKSVNIITKYEYDALNRRTKVIDRYDSTYTPDQTTGIYPGPKDKFGNYTGNVVTKTEYDVKTATISKDPENLETVKVSYASCADSVLRSVQKEYDVLGRVRRELSEKNNPTIYTYNKLGNLEMVQVQVKDSVTGTQKFNTTTYKYDELDRLKSTVEADENSNSNTVKLETQYTYDGVGNITSVVDKKGNTTQYYYNCLNQLEEVIDPQTTDGAICKTTYTYDETGNKKTVTDAKGNVTSYDYDLKNQLVSETDGEGSTQYYQYDGVGNKISESSRKSEYIKTSYVYDDLYRLEKIIDAMGKEQSVCAYDLQGNVLTEKDAYGNAATNKYDTFNRVIQTVAPGDNTISSNIVTFRYDSSGRVLEKKKALDTPNEYTVDTYAYDEFGNVVNHAQKKRVEDYKGNMLSESEVISTTTGYDEIGNKISEKIDDSSVKTFKHPYLLDSGSWTTKDEEINTKYYTYDALNRLRTTTVTIENEDLNTDGSIKIRTTEHTTRYAYDVNGNQSSSTEEIAEIDTAKNTRTLVSSNTWTDKYNAVNKLEEKLDPYQKRIALYSYDSHITQHSSTDALEKETVFDYDKNNRLLSTIDPLKLDPTTNKAVVHKSGQTYDEQGNVKTKYDGKGNTTQYFYDDLDRLESIVNNYNGTEINTSYTYDANGNMLTQFDGKYLTTFEYNVANKVSQKYDQGGKADPSKYETYTYYADGSLKTKTDKNGAATTYFYDSHGRIIKQRTGIDNAIGTITITYPEYDMNGNAKKVVKEVVNDDKTKTTITTERKYDALNRVVTKRETTQTGSTILDNGLTRYIYDVKTNTSDIPGMKNGCIAEKSIDPKSNKTVKIFDGAGRLNYVIDGDYQAGTAVDSTQLTTYNYNDNGSRASVVYPNKSKEEYQYYDDNLLWKLNNYKNVNDTIPTDAYEYHYDEAHNLDWKKEKIGQTYYQYDTLYKLSLNQTDYQ